jgi:Domain of unknown function (DUF397)
MNSWRKSTHSTYNGTCVEVAAWRKSSRSNSQGACVEAGSGPGVVGVRDSKNPGPVMEVTQEGWGAFLGRVRAGVSR